MLGMTQYKIVGIKYGNADDIDGVIAKLKIMRDSEVKFVGFTLIMKKSQPWWKRLLGKPLPQPS